MKAIIFIIFTALTLAFNIFSAQTIITVKVCNGSYLRPRVDCRGFLGGQIVEGKIWAKYPNYNYGFNADIDSEWICNTNEYNESKNEIKFKVPKIGITLLLRDGKVTEQKPGINQNCPLESF
jgi:hypothetical protein